MIGHCKMAALRTVKFNALKFFNVRYCSCNSVKKGLVLGAYTHEKSFKLTCTAQAFDKEIGGLLKQQLEFANLKQGKSRIFYRPNNEYNAVAIVGLGKEDLEVFNKEERFDQKKENIRIAAAAGCKSLQDLEIDQIDVEDLDDGEACAEGATLSLWSYQKWKQASKQKKTPKLMPFRQGDQNNWCSGIIKGEAQNLVRELAEAPANFMTPTIFAKCAENELKNLGIQLCVYDQDWVIEQKMGAFHSVAKGSVEPLKFIEMKYLNGDGPPIVLVGKGVTFDSGGISLKPSSKMDEMRADMAGAACVVGVMKAVAQLKVPINIIGLTPLCENLPSGTANKPGDIVQAMNGKFIQIDNTDAEGRLILADALCYAAKLDPKFVIDIATLTGAMRVALGGVMTGVFSNCDYLWEQLENAGQYTGDRVWRFPLVKEYTKRMTDFPSVDVNNVGKGTGGGACTAAAFLKEFAPDCGWMHLDVAGVMGPVPEFSTPYLIKGSTGRPTRTLVQFLKQLSCETN